MTNLLRAGTFYEGMTRLDAKKQGVEKAFLSRDFNNVDINKDNVLSRDEIILERKSMVKRKVIDGLITLACAIPIYKCAKGSKSILDIADKCFCIVAGIFSIGAFISAKKLHDENKKILS